jgi:hypothetical protein
VPPPPAPPSTTAQPNITKNPAPDSKETDNTLEKAMAALRQKVPPTAKPNPQQGGAPQVGGSPKGDITATLSDKLRGAIGDKVRECWTKDEGALDADKMQVMVTATLDPDGTVRIVEPADEDKGRVMGDPRLRAFFERARRAILDPRCGRDLVTKDKLTGGSSSKLTFRFRP